MASRVLAGRTGSNFSVSIYGLQEVDRALKAFAPDVRKEMYTSIKGALGRVVNEARSNVPSQPPMSGWRTISPKNAGVSRSRGGLTRGGAGWAPWNQNSISSGIKQGTGKNMGSGNPKIGKVAFALRSESAAGVIFEQSGRKSSGTGTGTSFINILNQRYGGASRLLWKAYIKQSKSVIADIASAVEKAEAEMVRRGDLQSGGGL